MSDGLQINVVLSGSQQTSVSAAGSPSVNVALGGGAVTTVQQEASATNLTSTPEPNLKVGFLGVQGPAASLLSAGGDDTALQFNDGGYLDGTANFFYKKGDNTLSVNDGSFIISNADFRATGLTSNTGAFLIQSTDGGNLFRVDTQNKKLILSEPADYYVGIGNDDPQEKLHINGNLRLDGNMSLGGNIVPQSSGVFNLGSPTRPFKELYIEGESIHFVNRKSKISSREDGGFTFTTEKDGEQILLFEVSEEGVHADGSLITGVPYTGLRDAGAFLQESVPQDSTSMDVEFGKTLSYIPQVSCNLVLPSATADLYYTSVRNVTADSCAVDFSNKVTGIGYILHVFVAPKNPTQ